MIVLFLSLIEDENHEDSSESSEEISDSGSAHSNGRKFKCRFCNRKFKQKGNMNKHLKQHLFPNVEQRKNFKWDICGSKYTERYNLKASITCLPFMCNLRL